MLPEYDEEDPDLLAAIGLDSKRKPTQSPAAAAAQQRNRKLREREPRRGGWLSGSKSQPALTKLGSGGAFSDSGDDADADGEAPSDSKRANAAHVSLTSSPAEDPQESKHDDGNISPLPGLSLASAWASSSASGDASAALGSGAGSNNVTPLRARRHKLRLAPVNTAESPFTITGPLSPPRAAAIANTLSFASTPAAGTHTPNPSPMPTFRGPGRPRAHSAATPLSVSRSTSATLPLGSVSPAPPRTPPSTPMLAPLSAGAAPLSLSRHNSLGSFLAPVSELSRDDSQVPIGTGSLSLSALGLGLGGMQRSTSAGSLPPPSPSLGAAQPSRPGSSMSGFGSFEPIVPPTPLQLSLPASFHERKNSWAAASVDTPVVHSLNFASSASAAAAATPSAHGNAPASADPQTPAASGSVPASAAQQQVLQSVHNVLFRKLEHCKTLLASSEDVDQCRSIAMLIAELAKAISAIQHV